MRAGLLLVLVSSGCASLLGVDEWSSESGGTPSTATGSTASGAGGDGTAAGGGGAGATSASSSSGAEGGAGGGACSKPVECWSGPVATPGLATCDSAGTASGECVPAPWDFCACAGQSPAVFVEVDRDGDPFAVTLIAPDKTEPYNLGINSGNCVDAPEFQCNTVCSSGDRLYRWTDFGPIQPPNIKELHVWWNDTGAPCDPGAGAGEGTELFVIKGL